MKLSHRVVSLVRWGFVFVSCSLRVLGKLGHLVRATGAALKAKRDFRGDASQGLEERLGVPFAHPDGVAQWRTKGATEGVRRLGRRRMGSPRRGRCRLHRLYWPNGGQHTL